MDTRARRLRFRLGGWQTYTEQKGMRLPPQLVPLGVVLSPPHLVGALCRHVMPGDTTGPLLSFRNNVCLDLFPRKAEAAFRQAQAEADAEDAARRDGKPAG